MKSQNSQHSNFPTVWLWTVVTIPLLASPVICFADEEQGGEDAPLLEQIDVTVPPQAERSRSVTVVTTAELKGKHFTNLNDALFSGIPGVATSRRSETGFSGPNSGFLIRGLQGPHVPVFVDGIPIQINNHFHARVDRYSSDMIDWMEVTRGPSVLKHGASAVGGVIDIYTRNPGKGASGYIQAAYGNYDTQEIFGDFGYGWDGGSVLFSASDRLTDGPPVEGGDFADEAHDLTNLNFKFTQVINDEWSIGFRASNAVEDPEDMPFTPDKSHRRFGQDETDFVVHLDRQTATSNSLIALHDNTLDNYNGSYTNGSLNPGTSRSFRKEDETGILGRHTWLRGAGNTTTVGFNFVKYSDDRFTGSGEKDESEFYSAYVQASQGFGDSLRVDGGVRITEGEDFDTDVSPEIGIVKTISSTLAVRARGGKAFRVPRLGDNDIDQMPTLDVEEFTHAELGINKRFGAGGEIDVTAWWMGGDNLIVRNGFGASAYETNTGEFDHSGIEAYLTYSISQHLSMFLTATVMSLEVTTSSPQNIYDLGLDYVRGRFRGNLVLRDASRNANPVLADEDYTVLDGRFQFSVTDNIDLFLDIDNITDERYVTFYGFGSKSVNVERLVMFGGRWSYGQ